VRTPLSAQVSNPMMDIKLEKPHIRAAAAAAVGSQT
jgi:hypothetical protein